MTDEQVRPDDPGSMSVWDPSDPDDDERPQVTIGSVLRGGAPALVVAVLVGWLVSPKAGVVVALLATIVTLTAVAVPAVGRGLERLFSVVGSVVGRVLTTLVLGTVFVVVFVPVGLLRRLLRSDPLHLGSPSPGSEWVGRRGWLGRRLPERSYASERDLAVGRGRVIAGVGVLAVLLVADLALGTVLIGPPGSEERTGVGGSGPEAIPALADEPYVTGLFTETFSAQSGRYDPFLGWRLADVEGEYLNIEDGARRSYRPEGVPGEPVVVWFFGGSTMYGFGQRDEHTIASEVVRLAEQDGIAVEAHNFGTPAYDNWQETQLFARLLTEREAPDVAVFYDGYNDISQQLVDGPHTEPSHVLARVRQQAIERPPDEVDAGDVRAWLADHSATTNVYRRVRDRFGGTDEPEVQFTEANSRVPDDVDVDEVVASTEVLMERGRGLARALGEQYGVEVVFWWQPTLYSREPDVGEDGFFTEAENRSEAWFPVTGQLAGALPDDVVDLSAALDDVPGPVYWDTVHTNERGAALVAATAYQSLLSSLRTR